ncbi:MAG: M48 family metalloprotease [Kiloniellales bacterium]|nr:M48 family metalloprotease [Kiloniellales bacterium]
MVSRLPVLLLGVALAALPAACAPSFPGDPAPGASEGAALPRDVELRQLLAQQARLWDIGYLLLSRSTDLCAGRQRTSFGFQAWTRWDIGGSYRIASMAAYGLDDQLRVVHILPGSPAAEAGLHAGDVIEKIYWHEIPSGRKASAAMQQILEREAQVGAPLAFYLRRGGDRLVIDIVPRRRCDFDLILTGSNQINAFFDGQRVYVTDGLARFFGDDAELAAVIGHVLGHALLGHAGDWSLPEEVMERLGALQMATMEPEDRDRLLAAGITPEARPFSQAQEIEADDLARQLLSRAGIRPEALADAWRRLANVTEGAVLLRDFHPATPERLNVIGGS